MSWILVLLTQVAFAQDSKLTYFESEDRFEFVLGLQASQMTTSLGAATGFGPVVEFDYGLSTNFSTGMLFSQVFDTSERAALFLDIYGFVQYSLTGSALGSRRRILYQGETVVDEFKQKRSGLSLGVGPEQLIVNGSVSAYPSSGVAASLHWDTTLIATPVGTHLRFSTLSARGESLTVFSFHLGFRF